MNKLESLAQASLHAHQEHLGIRPGSISSDGVYDLHFKIVDAVLNELLEPGETARKIMAERFGFKPDEALGEAKAFRLSNWQAVLTAIKAGE